MKWQQQENINEERDELVSKEHDSTFSILLMHFCGGKNNDVQWQNMAET